MDTPFTITTHSSAASLRGLFIVDHEVVWASGSKGTVLRSTDGARTWTSVGPEYSASLDFRDVHAFDVDNAVIMAVGSPARFYQTENGGRDWRLVHEDERPAAFFDAMSFWDDQNGIAFSDPVDGRLLIIRTGDGGRTWQEIPRDQQPATIAGEGGFAASGTCLCLAGDAVFIGLGNAEVYSGEWVAARMMASRDRGENWQVVQTPVRSAPASGIFSIVFVDDQHGVAVGGTYDQPQDGSANACISDDGGKSWRMPNTAPRGYRSCVAVRQSDSGPQLIAVSRAGSDISRDFGNTWQALDDEVFYAVDFSPDGKLGIAVGPDGRIGVWRN